MQSFGIEAGKSNIEAVQKSFAHAVGEIQHRFSPDSSPKGFFIILQDGVTGDRFADSFSWKEAKLKSQSVPYRFNRSMLDMAEIVAGSTIPKLLVCDEHSAIPLWDWVVAEQRNGLYLMKLRDDRMEDLCILDSGSRIFPRRNPIPQIPTSVLR